MKWNINNYYVDSVKKIFIQNIFCQIFWIILVWTIHINECVHMCCMYCWFVYICVYVLVCVCATGMCCCVCMCVCCCMSGYVSMCCCVCAYVFVCCFLMCLLRVCMFFFWLCVRVYFFLALCVCLWVCMFSSIVKSFNFIIILRWY